MKAHKAFWRVLCWTGAIILLNAALSTCFSYEPKIEDEPEAADTTAARARVEGEPEAAEATAAEAKAVIDSVPMPIFKQDSLATTATMDTAAALVPTELTFSDSALADTLYAREKKQGQPFYKKWWFIAVVAGAVTATAIAIASGDEGKAKEDLPGFPDPPDK